MNCQYGRDAYCAGSVVVALLQIPRGSISIQRDSVVLAQALGTITLDNKWIKTARIPFVQTPQYPMDQSMTIPPLPSPNTHCFFITPREVLSTTLLNDGGVFLLFDLPIDVIPSHKGLACSISYNIAITVQTPGEPNKQTKFPFSVLGHGSSATIPYEIRCSSLAVFGSGAVPTENALLCPIEGEESDDIDRQTGSFLGQLFNIRDREFVCSLSMMSQLHQLHPGSDLCISLSFEGGVQRCFSVRAYLQQCENRSDGSRVQDKVIVESSRATLSACLVHLNLHVPETISSSFSSPLVKVCYQIVVEFFLDRDGHNDQHHLIDKSDRTLPQLGPSVVIDENDHGEPFTWVLPAEIQPLRYTKNLAREINACRDPAVELSHGLL